MNLLKKKMIDLAKGTGINSYEILRCSQELDT
ncbi:aspartyl-phosphate phosphatase Spo0E family protein [Bacillus salipaludis]|nr:aspartyl-phosphate phosphatase Spo0E family protein [Bacillus salipaludis]